MAADGSKTEEQFDNGSEILNSGEEEHSIDASSSKLCGETQVLEVLREMGRDIVNTKDRIPFIQRSKRVLKEKGPILKQALKDSTDNLVRWMRRGGPWRVVLVVSVGMILLLALTGLGAFTLFFMAVTTYTVVIAFLMSLAALGGFVAIFFTCLTAIYVSALSIAAFVISTATLLTISAVLIAVGWIGFLWIIWQGIRKSLNITRDSLVITVSALSAISKNRRLSREDY